MDLLHMTWFRTLAGMFCNPLHLYICTYKHREKDNDRVNEYIYISQNMLYVISFRSKL